MFCPDGSLCWLHKNQLQHVSESFPNRKLIHVLSSEMSNSLQPCTLGAIKQSGLDWKSSCPPSHCGFLHGNNIPEEHRVWKRCQQKGPGESSPHISEFSLLFLLWRHFTAHITNWVHSVFGTAAWISPGELGSLKKRVVPNKCWNCSSHPPCPHQYDSSQKHCLTFSGFPHRLLLADVSFSWWCPLVHSSKQLNLRSAWCPWPQHLLKQKLRLLNTSQQINPKTTNSKPLKTLPCHGACQTMSMLKTFGQVLPAMQAKMALLLPCR